MIKRLLMGPVLILGLVGLLALDDRAAGRGVPGWEGHAIPPGAVIALACAAIAVFGAMELSAMLRDKGLEGSRRLLSIGAVAGVLVSALAPGVESPATGVAIVSTCAMLVLLASLGFYSRHKTTRGVLAGAAGVVLAFVYLGLMFGFVLAVRREHSAWVLLWVLLVIKSCDIGAYFTGKAIGRHKLIPWLSPGKTWEGLAGGVVLSTAAAVAGREALARSGAPLGLSMAGAAGAGIVFALAGQIGDLVMSLFKRDAGVKDSGKSLPGFGGVLDVLDSPLLVTPLAFWWLRAGW